MPDGVTIDRDVVDGVERVGLIAARDLSGVATGRFSRLSANVALQFGAQPKFLGFAYTQFALPVVAEFVAGFRLQSGAELAITSGARRLAGARARPTRAVGSVGPSARAGHRRC